MSRTNRKIVGKYFRHPKTLSAFKAEQGAISELNEEGYPVNNRLSVRSNKGSGSAPPTSWDDIYISALSQSKHQRKDAEKLRFKAGRFIYKTKTQKHDYLDSDYLFSLVINYLTMYDSEGPYHQDKTQESNNLWSYCNKLNIQLIELGIVNLDINLRDGAFYKIKLNWNVYGTRRRENRVRRCINSLIRSKK